MESWNYNDDERESKQKILIREKLWTKFTFEALPAPGTASPLVEMLNAGNYKALFGTNDQPPGSNRMATMNLG